MALHGSARLFNRKTIVLNLFLLYGFAVIGGVVIPQFIGTFHRGFFCDDASIRYPYKADTITNTNLFLYAIFVIILTVIATEWHFDDTSNSDNSTWQLKVGKTTVPSFIVTSMVCIGYAQIGAVSLYVIINLTKITVGRLRPHFLDVCKPKDLVCRENEYITNYVCTGDEDLVLEARKSFFSGHSAIAMYSSTFAALYLLSRIPRGSAVKVFLPVLQTILIVTGLMISYSRINDNKHHWSDVVVGVIVGVFFALYTCLVVAGMFNEPEEELLPFGRQKTNYVTGNSAMSSDQLGADHSYPEEI